MTLPPPDGSRDRRIEDPTNLWLIHPAARRLLPIALALRVSANAVSLIGLALGSGAAIAYWNWASPVAAFVGLLLSIAWLIADGLDGMVARATGTASPFGRLLDGICDHGVFVLIYVLIATHIGTGEGWALALTAGAAHVAQSSTYEAERARFHRRVRGDAGTTRPQRAGGVVEWLYDNISRGIDRLAEPFDRLLRDSDDPRRLGAAYGAQAAPAMKLMALESANMRVYAIFLACLLGNPRFFWWFEIVPLTLILVIGLIWHRRVEGAFTRPDRTSALPT
ncbi:CDP-alcohol phosphatidyltransferase family protein [Sphingomonas sp. RT2P30]|uniref:CDP-alcohol phosphatidyltransferase family protein n=1 Tax=Parasphingomonas halimpatiens TaxID=3096162 RepID=UPI002FC7A099